MPGVEAEKDILEVLFSHHQEQQLDGLDGKEFYARLTIDVLSP